MTEWSELVDIAVLERWMDARGLGTGAISAVSLLAGGTQNILLRFDRAGRGFVLRRPPPHPRPESNETMRREMRMLAALAETEVPHPRLIAACPDTAVLGSAFYLMEPIDGFNPVAEMPGSYATDPEWRHRMGLALVDGIAALGGLCHRDIGLGNFGRPDRYLERQVPRWSRQLASYEAFAGWPGPASLPGVERIAQWLAAHRPAHFEPGLLHGDYHFANVLFRRDRPELAAIVDWELATVGDPLIDLGWLLATWPDPASPGPVAITPADGLPNRTALIERYRERSTRDLSAIDWYAVMGCFKLGILLEGTHARACAGKAPAATGQKLHADAIGLFERALAWIG